MMKDEIRVIDYTEEKADYKPVGDAMFWGRVRYAAKQTALKIVHTIIALFIFTSMVVGAITIVVESYKFIY